MIKPSNNFKKNLLPLLFCFYVSIAFSQETNPNQFKVNKNTQLIDKKNSNSVLTKPDKKKLSDAKKINNEEQIMQGSEKSDEKNDYAKQELYSGGMLFFQPGYTITKNNQQKIEDISFGIGGILRLYFYNYFTAGIFGGTHKTSYNSTGSSDSYLNFGYGGPFIGLSHKTGKFRFSLSAFTGMGKIKNLHIEKQINDTITNAYLYKKSAIVISPLVSADYAITQKLSFTLQAICLFSKFEADKKIVNPVIQIGILINR